MKLIVGLGNPGKKYEKTRHNVGFRVIDFLGDKYKIDVDKENFKGLVGRGVICNQDVMLFKPQTFMNLSGNAVLAITQFFKIALEDVIIVFDDMALPVGKIRLRLAGSSGGHNGMQNIIDLLHTQDIKRIRLGIGEPTFNSVDYVLGRPTAEEEKEISFAVEKAVSAIEETLMHDFNFAMTKYN